LRGTTVEGTSSLWAERIFFVIFLLNSIRVINSLRKADATSLASITVFVGGDQI
jgi:hypothetical protein